MTLYALAAIGKDRPGIVAKVASVLAFHGANLEDSTMASLAGHFAIMLIIDTSAEDNVEVLRADLSQVGAELGLWIDLKSISRSYPTDEISQTISISVHGADRTGIVAGIANVLADYDASIVDMTTHRLNSLGTTSYVMSLEVDLGIDCSDDSVARLVAALSEKAVELGVTVKVHDPDGDLL